jgi:mRNA-degrading endonuclease RelE of RelBE toxin-antitoxin system
MTWNIKPSHVFERDYKSLPPHIQMLIPDILRSLREDPLQDFLSTHPLRERLAGYHACSVDESYRVIIRLSQDKKLITLMDVGKHDIYKRY